MRRLLLCLLPLASAALLDKPADLSYELNSNTTYCPGDTPFKLQEQVAKVTDKGYWYASNNITSPEHCGTHLDAPAHINKGGLTVDQIPLGNLLAAGILLNVTEEVGDNTNYTLQVSKLEEWENKNGLIPQNAVVIICFGWTSRWHNKTAFFGPSDDDLRFPGISKEAAEWLAKKEEVVGVGVDTPSVDVGSSQTLDAHVILSKRNIYILENVKLNETLPVLFNLAVMPMKIKNGTGAPVRLFAMKPHLVDPEKLPGGKNATEEEINRTFGHRRGGFFPIPIPIPIPFGGFKSHKNKYKSYPGYSNYGAGMLGGGMLGGLFGGSKKHSGQGYYPGQGGMGYPGQGGMGYPGQGGMGYPGQGGFGQGGFPSGYQGGAAGGYPGGVAGAYPAGAAGAFAGAAAAGAYPGAAGGAYPGAAGGAYPGAAGGAYPGAAGGAYPGAAGGAYPGAGAGTYAGGAAGAYPGGASSGSHGVAPPAYSAGAPPAYPGAPPAYPGGAPPPYSGGAPPAYPGGAPPPYPGGPAQSAGAPPPYPGGPAHPSGSGLHQGAPPAYGPAVPGAPAPSAPLAAGHNPAAPPSPVGANKPAPYPQQSQSNPSFPQTPPKSSPNAAKADPIGFKQSVINPPASSSSSGSKPKQSSSWTSWFTSSGNQQKKDSNLRDVNVGRRKSGGRRGGGSRRRH